jgi:hypothetical protein
MKISKPLLLLIFLCVISFFIILYYTGTRQKLIQYVRDCENMLAVSNGTYVICCKDERGMIYLCNDKKTFKPGEYIGIQIDVRKLNNNYFSKYYVCAYSNFPIRDAPLPKDYDKKNVQAMEISGYESFTCSKFHFSEDYSHLALSGYVEPERGDFILAKVWLFPEGDYKDINDFKTNINKAKLVLELRGRVE